MLEMRDDETFLNPLDNVEDILAGNNWVYNRTNDDELIVSIAGRHCSYNLYFLWQEHMNAVQYVCEYEMNINPENKICAYETIMDMNATLWMGHFEVMRDSLIPSFRYTLLQGASAQAECIENIVEISLAQCERFQPVFQVLAHEIPANPQSLSLAMMDTSGES